MSDFYPSYFEPVSAKGHIIRVLWAVVWTVLARPLPRTAGNGWKLFLLRLFGAKVDRKAVVYSSAKIYYPKHLIMEAESVLGPEVDCYNVDKIVLKKGAIVSQKTYLCGGSHDVSDPDRRLIAAPIVIGERAWVAADAFVKMGVTIGEGAVVAARSVVVKDIQPWTIVGGNPAKYIKDRVLIETTKID